MLPTIWAPEWPVLPASLWVQSSRGEAVWPFGGSLSASASLCPAGQGQASTHLVFPAGSCQAQLAQSPTCFALKEPNTQLPVCPASQV